MENWNGLVLHFFGAEFRDIFPAQHPAFKRYLVNKPKGRCGLSVL